MAFHGELRVKNLKLKWGTVIFKIVMDLVINKIFFSIFTRANFFTICFKREEHFFATWC